MQDDEEASNEQESSDSNRPSGEPQGAQEGTEPISPRMMSPFTAAQERRESKSFEIEE